MVSNKEASRTESFVSEATLLCSDDGLAPPEFVDLDLMSSAGLVDREGFLICVF